jgi:hypothetical protein
MSQTAFPYQPYALGGILAVNQSITSISNGNGLVVVFTVAGHGYTSGQYIRHAGITGQTALNGNWIINVLTVNTYSLQSGTGVVPGVAPLGNGVASSAGTVAATPLPITVNRPTFAGQGIQVQALACQIYPGNSGSVYIGVIIPGVSFMSNVTPFIDTCYILKNTLTAPQNIPVFSPVNVNVIQIDKFWVDYDTIGDGVLISAFQR